MKTRRARKAAGEEIIAWIEATWPVLEGILTGRPIALMDWHQNHLSQEMAKIGSR